MKTSSRVGRATVDRRDAHAELGEQAGHERLAGVDVEGHRALGHRRLDAEAVAQRGQRGVVVGGAQHHPVGPDARLERLGRVEHDDLAAVHDRDAVAELRLVHVVRGHEDRRALGLLQCTDVAPDRAAGLGVEADGRLVEEQHARRVHQAAGDLQAPSHAAGVRLHRRVTAVPEVDHLEHLAHPRRDDLGVDAVELGVQAEVLLGGEVAVERRVLEHEADVPADGVALADDVEAAHAGGTGRGPGERAQHVDRRALAGAVGAEEAEDLAASDGERDTADGLDLAVGLDECLDLDGGWGEGMHGAALSARPRSLRQAPHLALL